jgi:hypothetical protein
MPLIPVHSFSLALVLEVYLRTFFPFPMRTRGRTWTVTKDINTKEPGLSVQLKDHTENQGLAFLTLPGADYPRSTSFGSINSFS